MFLFSARKTRLMRFLFLSLFGLLLALNSASWALPVKIAREQPLPDAVLIGEKHAPVHLKALKGRVKIVSLVPQLNTPVCDEQTHRFSEKNEGLDRYLDIVTISTNSHDDQVVFAEKAGISNVTFLSDAPDFDFGKKTGLLHPMHQILQRAVLVVDERNIVRYIEIVPMSQLPNFAAVLTAARRVLGLRDS